MPRGDRTGPEGNGHMTGRRLGNCNPDSQRENRFYGEGRHCGCGNGNRHRNGYRVGFGYNRLSEDSEKKALEAEVSILKDQISAMEKRLSELAQK